MQYDIIIPHYGLTDRLNALCRNCLLSIVRHTQDYRLILIDNASPHLTDLREILTKMPKHTIVHNSTNLGFVRAVNQGLALSTAEHVIIMNNDTQAVCNWTTDLRAGFSIDSRVAAVGPKTTAKSWQGRTPWTGPPRLLPKDGMLAFFCTMFKSSAIHEVGNLDESFGVGLGDDSDYCRRLHVAGYRLAFVPDLVIPHHHRSTFDAVFGHAQVAKMQDAALERYKQKWPD